MGLLYRVVVCASILVSVSFPAPEVHAAQTPVNIIFDTDMGGDCDDVGALFILHGAVERGQARLLATMGCISADAIAPALDGINTWFGRPEIPVGTLKDPGLLVGPHYTTELAKRFAHRFSSGKDYPDAVVPYRQILTNDPDGSVVTRAPFDGKGISRGKRLLPRALVESLKKKQTLPNTPTHSMIK